MEEERRARDRPLFKVAVNEPMYAVGNQSYAAGDSRTRAGDEVRERDHDSEMLVGCADRQLATFGQAFITRNLALNCASQPGRARLYK